MAVLTRRSRFCIRIVVASKVSPAFITVSSFLVHKGQLRRESAPVAHGVESTITNEPVSISCSATTKPARFFPGLISPLNGSSRSSERPSEFSASRFVLRFRCVGVDQRKAFRRPNPGQ